MSDKEFHDLWAGVQGKLSKLRDVPIDDLNVWCVDHNGLGELISVGSCRDFCSATRPGSIIVMRDRSAFLKVHREYWVLTAPGITGLVLIHDADIIHMLLSDKDQGQVATLLNYKEGHTSRGIGLTAQKE